MTYSYQSPMFPCLKHCAYCGRKLSKVPSKTIVCDEQEWGFGEYHISRTYYCSKECAKKEYDAELKHELSTISDNQKLNKYIKSR